LRSVHGFSFQASISAYHLNAGSENSKLSTEKYNPLRPKIKRTAPSENEKVKLKRENLKRIAKHNHREKTVTVAGLPTN